MAFPIFVQGFVMGKVVYVKFTIEMPAATPAFKEFHDIVTLIFYQHIYCYFQNVHCIQNYLLKTTFSNHVFEFI